MFRSSSIAVALLAVACTSVCIAQDKPADPAAATLPGATSINLQLEAASPEEAFGELAKQANVQIRPMDPSIWAKADPVELTVENGKFWPVLIDMCQQANVQFNPNYLAGGGRTVQISGSSPGMGSLTNLPYAEVQGCVIALTHATRNYQIVFGSQNQTHTSVGFQGMFIPDPGVAFSGTLRTIVTEAVDENGTSLAPPRNDDPMYGGAGRSAMMQHVFIQLTCPPNAGKKLVRLTGEIMTSIVGKSEVLSVNLPIEGAVTKDLSAMSVEIKAARSTPNGAEVDVALRPKRPGREFQNSWNLLSAIELQDEKGNRFLYSGVTRNSGSPTGMEVTVQFSKQNRTTGQPAKLTWTLPTETKEVRLPFEFKDLPIP